MKKAYIIEDADSSKEQPMFCTAKLGITWTYLVQDALFFARLQDAQQFAEKYLSPVKVRFTEQQWG